MSDLLKVGNLDPHRWTELAPCTIPSLAVSFLLRCGSSGLTCGFTLSQRTWVGPRVQWSECKIREGVALLSIKLQSTNAGGQG